MVAWLSQRDARAKVLLLGSSPLCRFCRLAPPLIRKFPEEQSYPSEDQT